MKKRGDKTHLSRKATPTRNDFVYLPFTRTQTQADSRVTFWPSADAHQCHTPAALSRAYVEKPGHTSFQDQGGGHLAIRAHVSLEHVAL